MPIRIASCHCGQLRLSCSGEPRKISMCHCLDCQRRTGSVFSIAIFYERGMIQIERGSTAFFERPSASGKSVKFHFCASCGSNVFWEPERLPDLIGVAAGAFADPDFPMPTQSVWTRDKHSWLPIPPDIAQFAMNPPQRQAKQVNASSA